MDTTKLEDSAHFWWDCCCCSLLVLVSVFYVWHAYSYCWFNWEVGAISGAAPGAMLEVVCKAQDIDWGKRVVILLVYWNGRPSRAIGFW